MKTLRLRRACRYVKRKTHTKTDNYNIYLLICKGVEVLYLLTNINSAYGTSKLSHFIVVGWRKGLGQDSNKNTFVSHTPYLLQWQPTLALLLSELLGCVPAKTIIQQNIFCRIHLCKVGSLQTIQVRPTDRQVKVNLSADCHTDQNKCFSFFYKIKYFILDTWGKREWDSRKVMLK